MRRRTLYRTLAVAAAIAAITPLFAADRCGGDQGNRQQTTVQHVDSQSR